MKAPNYPNQNLALECWVWIRSEDLHINTSTEQAAASAAAFDLLYPFRYWLDGIEVREPKLARFLCQKIPAHCPFERDIRFFGRKLLHIPPLCKLNPLYEQVAALRFRALCYLADVCGEDVSPYC
ncbi:nitrogenase [Neosynechococcus sphagnicola sy1]|uniref:Nitrogenase n=1 Tax=Neosynechococcus sphagnicola sy1 TaxID=1497020 RepID=A0A098TJD9_9CYAN|nr:Mo-dependent nitrogenase C-terminal domain-containing protein [Neosynechococcus sphagnicola]KGF72244.1 nitrogenase [Neosynechococcus sphagnicola sy1]